MSFRALLLLGTLVLAPACTVHTGSYPEPAAPVVYGNAPVYSYAPVYATPAPVYGSPAPVYASPAPCVPASGGAPLPVAQGPVYVPASPAPAAAPRVAPPAQPTRIAVRDPRIVAPHAREPRVVRASAPRIVRAAEPSAVRPAEPRVVSVPRVVQAPVASPPAVERPTRPGVAIAPHAPDPRVDPARIHTPVRDVRLRPFPVHPVVVQPSPTALRAATPARL
jgi:hypothetical protein